MKIIKKLILAILMLFSFAACTSTVNFKTSVAPVKASQKKVIVANYPDNVSNIREYFETSFRYDGWQVTSMNFWKAEEINPKQRKETFLVVIDKLRRNGESFMGDPLYDGNIRVYDLRTGNVIIDHKLYSDGLLDTANGVEKAINSLVVK